MKTNGHRVTFVPDPPPRPHALRAFWCPFCPGLVQPLTEYRSAKCFRCNTIMPIDWHPEKIAS